MGGIKKWEIISIVALAILFFLLASFNLGSFKLPSSYWQPQLAVGEEVSVVFDFGNVQPLKEIYIFLADEKRTKFDIYAFVEGKSDWRIVSYYDNDPLRHVHFYSWDKINLGNGSVETRFLKLRFSDGESKGRIGEILVISAENKKVDIIGVESIEDAKKLADEQNLVKFPITSQEGAYFDEMYFVRTAYEHLSLKEPYETTHPPLGKLIIALGILCFGMNPFGWRVLGVLAATAMIPILFLFARKMFKSGAAGFFAAFLLAFEFMHFSLARLATGEIYISLFSLLMFYFFFDYLSRRTGEEGRKERIIPLFLCIVFFGLCFTVKWTAVFGFLAILILFFDSNFKNGESSLRIFASKPIFSDFRVILAGLLVSAAIYIATYIPYMFSGGGHGLGDVLTKQFGMFGYHAFLRATHPFSSPWWSWHLMLKPLWMYSNYLDGVVSTIVLMGNPAIWWSSIPALISIAIMLVRNNIGDKVQEQKKNFIFFFILIPFLLQWLPYALISRILFIYHFVPNIPFMIFAVTYWLHLPFEKKKLSKKRGFFFKCNVFAFLILSAFLFFLFYPVISGYPVAYEYKEGLKWLKGWVF